MTLYDHWQLKLNGDIAKGMDLLPYRALPLAITDRMRQMAARGVMNTYHLEKLTNALRKYAYQTTAAIPIAAAPQKPVIPVTPPKDQKKTEPSATKIPDDHPLYQTARGLLKSHGHYHALLVQEGLNESPDRETLAGLSKKVLDLSDQIDKLYSKYRKSLTNDA